MIDFCGYKFQVGAQSIHLYPIANGLWQMHAVTVIERLGQVLPNDPRLIGITISADPNSLDPDALPGDCKAYVSQARDITAVIEATTRDFKDFASRYGGVAFASLTKDGSWIIKGVARKMCAELE